MKILKQKLEKRLEEVQYFGEFSLKLRSSGTARKLREKIAVIEELLEDKNRLKVVLARLERGVPLELVYRVDNYSGKLRLVGKLRGAQRIEKEVILSLIASKIADYLKKEEKRPAREKAVGKLLKFLDQNKGKSLIVVKGDFKSYTLNIPISQLEGVLEKRGIPAEAVLPFLKRRDNFSTSMSKLNLPLFFKKVGYGSSFETDPEFKVISGIDGLPPGIPLSNVLGQIFLLDFDRKLEELAGDAGLSIRYFDDFILIRPLREGEDRREEEKKIKRELKEWLVSHYGITCDKINKIVEFDNVEEEIDFLGYIIKFTGKKVKSFIRYKTLKKFIYKYTHEYTFSNYCRRRKISVFFDEREAAHYLISKIFYLYQWLNTFIYVNEPKLLDEIFTKIVLPDLHLFFKTYFDFSSTMASEVRSNFHPYFRLTTIHRRLKKFKKAASSSPLPLESGGVTKVDLMIRDEVLKLKPLFEQKLLSLRS